MKLTSLSAILLLLAGTAPLASGALAAGGLVDIERRLSADADNLELANAYRREVIRTGEYNRALRFFEDLVRRYPRAVNARLSSRNHGRRLFEAAGRVRRPRCAR